MNHRLDQLAKDCIDACNVCTTECGSCFAHMVGEERHNDCPACCIECAAIYFFCADAIARQSPFAQKICKLWRISVNDVRNNAARMTWTTAGAAPSRAVDASKLAAQWPDNPTPSAKKA